MSRGGGPPLPEGVDVDYPPPGGLDVVVGARDRQGRRQREIFVDELDARPAGLGNGASAVGGTWGWAVAADGAFGGADEAADG